MACKKAAGWQAARTPSPDAHPDGAVVLAVHLPQLLHRHGTRLHHRAHHLETRLDQSGPPRLEASAGLLAQSLARLPVDVLRAHSRRVDAVGVGRVSSPAQDVGKRRLDGAKGERALMSGEVGQRAERGEERALGDAVHHFLREHQEDRARLRCVIGPHCVMSTAWLMDAALTLMAISVDQEGSRPLCLARRWAVMSPRTCRIEHP